MKLISYLMIQEEDSIGDKFDKNTRLGIIALTGMPGCGKGEVSRICSEMGARVYSLGDEVRDHFSRTQKDRDPAEIGEYADSERKKHGMDVWARHLFDHIEKDMKAEGGLVIIDGLRSMHEALVFKDRLGVDFRIFAIHSSPKTRYERLMGRERGDDPNGMDEFDERDRRELGWGLGDVVALADMMLVNETGLMELEMRIRTIMFSEMKGKGL